MLVTAAVAVLAGVNTAVTPGLVAGMGAGACLLLAAVGSLAAAAIGRRRGARRLSSVPYD